MKFDYRIFSEDGRKLLASGYTKHACVNDRGRVVRPPDFLSRIVRENSQPDDSPAGS